MTRDDIPKTNTTSERERRVQTPAPLHDLTKALRRLSLVTGRWWGQIPCRPVSQSVNGGRAVRVDALQKRYQRGLTVASAVGFRLFSFLGICRCAASDLVNVKVPNLRGCSVVWEFSVLWTSEKDCKIPLFRGGEARMPRRKQHCPKRMKCKLDVAWRYAFGLENAAHHVSWQKPAEAFRLETESHEETLLLHRLFRRNFVKLKVHAEVCILVGSSRLLSKRSK